MSSFVRLSLIDKFNENSRAHFLLHSKPLGYPRDYPCEPSHGFPIFEPLTKSDIPVAMHAFNDLGRVLDPKTTLLHFHKADEKFAHVLIDPLKFGNKWGHFMCLASPDVTLSDGMVEWERIKNTSWSRAVAATWASQGIKVIPTLRWRLPTDYDFVVCGLPKHSVFAVSTYGSVRDAELKRVFIDGLREMVKRLEPIAIIVYGTGIKNIHDIVGPGVEVYLHPTPTQRIREEKARLKNESEARLF